MVQPDLPGIQSHLQREKRWLETSSFVGWSSARYARMRVYRYMSQATNKASATRGHLNAART